MKRVLYTILFSFLVASVAYATDPKDRVSTSVKDSVFSVKVGGSLTQEMPDVLEEGIFISTNPTDSIRRLIAKGRTIIDSVRTLGKYITNLNEATSVTLPVGLKKYIPGITWDLAIEAIRLKPTYAELDIFLEFEIPQNGEKLMFMGRNIKFTKQGGIVGDARLELLGNYGINFNGDKVQLILKGSLDGTGTYATIDCDGFREMGIDGEVKFSRDMLLPEKPDGSISDGNLVATFKTKIINWNDLLIELDLPNFQVKNFNDFSFSARNVVFDFSDTRNATSIQFPEGYNSTQILPGNETLWRGFYMRELTVKLPSEFKQRGTTVRTMLQASNVIIDNMGLTGNFRGTTLITLQQGDMNGWAFSLDSLNVDIQTNQLVEAGFFGHIVIPVSNEKTPFDYKAIISTGGNYLFSVSPAKDISFDVFSAAHVDIYESSFLDIAIIDHKFRPKANLNGRLGIAAKLSAGGKGVELANITFENLEIQSVKPYIKVGSFSFGSEAAQQKMAGFPISIHDIGLKSYSDTEVGLDFNLKLNLVGESNGAFAADAGLTILGTMNAEKGWQSWKYKTVQVREIAVDIDGGAFKINGKLIFYRNDVTYGDGFNGMVKAEFTPGIKITATAIFGSVNGLRYWYADAMVNFPSAIPIFTGVGIYGFGGGAYFAMKMDNKGLGSDLGRTASGVVYIPDEKAGLGLKAIVNLGSMPKPEAFNADVTFEISFFKGGGVRYIAFGGNGYLSTPGIELDLDKMKGAAGKMVSAVNKVADKLPGAAKGLLDSGGDSNSMNDIFGEIGEKAGQKGQISARVMISFDFENHVLHGNFEVYVNVAGGIIKGVGAGGRAGWSVLHFAPHEWYIWAGTPDDRMGISIGVGSVQLAATTYFMVGTKILNSPPPPPEVGRILGGVDLDYMKDLNSLGTGAGFAFGAALSMKTGDLSFLMFYASFSAGLGFDIMLKNYGEVYCKGSSKRMGVNGWYANGQAYAYFEGGIGVKVKIFGKSKKVQILEIGAAAVMQAKLPNPFWMRGIVGGYFRVLGGLVKGNCKFQVTIGKECEIIRDQNAILDEIKIISELTPASNEIDVNVFTTPQAVFNIPIEETFVLDDDLSGLGKRTFRIKLDHFKLIADKNELQGTIQWNEGNDVLAFNSFEVLPSQKDVTVSVQVSFEEQKNGQWSIVKTDGQPVVERFEQTFKTGVAPDYIPLENIEYCYPIIGQVNFHKDESRDGYIKLKVGQAYLFEVGAEWKQLGRFAQAAGDKTYFDFVYTTSAKTVSFSVPSSLKNSLTYAFELVNIPAQKAGAIDRNVTQVSSQVESEGQALDTEITTKKAEGSIDELQEKSIVTYYLHTSKYNTFSEKIDQLTVPNAFQWETYNGVSKLYTNITGPELFDKFETDPSNSTSSIVFEAIPDNEWYTTIIHPLLYEGYPVDGKITLSNRNTSVMGVPPVKSVYFLTQTDNIIEQDKPDVLRPFPSNASLQYYFPVEIGNDYLNMRAIAANLSVSQSSPRINALLTASWKNVIPNRNYKVKVSYVLPGTRKISSEKIIPLYFTIIRR